MKVQAKKQTNGSAEPKASYGIEESKLQKLFEDSLKDIFWAEKALASALPKMASKASSPELVKAIEKHTSETEGQVERLEKVFELLGKNARGKKCEAMEGLIKEGKTIMEETDEGAMRDAGIIAASQKIEHYEIATYGTLCTYAEMLGLDKAAKLLASILEEEKATDETLSKVARGINLKASEEKEDE